jgi:hypothetical protein
MYGHFVSYFFYPPTIPKVVLVSKHVACHQVTMPNLSQKTLLQVNAQPVIRDPTIAARFSCFGLSCVRNSTVKLMAKSKPSNSAFLAMRARPAGSFTAAKFLQIHPLRRAHRLCSSALQRGDPGVSLHCVQPPIGRLHALLFSDPRLSVFKRGGRSASNSACSSSEVSVTTAKVRNRGDLSPRFSF